jgi:hypothetical protein
MQYLAFFEAVRVLEETVRVLMKAVRELVVSVRVPKKKFLRLENA